MKKGLAIAVCVLMISLSVPHFSLWGFGVAAGNAVLTCTPNGLNYYPCGYEVTSITSTSANVRWASLGVTEGRLHYGDPSMNQVTEWSSACSQGQNFCIGAIALNNLQPGSRTWFYVETRLQSDHSKTGVSSGSTFDTTAAGGGNPPAGSAPAVTFGALLNGNFFDGGVQIAPGQTVALSWSVDPQTSSVSIDHGIGTVAALDSRTVPTSTTMYTLTATANGQTTTKTATITVTSTPQNQEGSPGGPGGTPGAPGGLSSAEVILPSTPIVAGQQFTIRFQFPQGTQFSAGTRVIYDLAQLSGKRTQQCGVNSCIDQIAISVPDTYQLVAELERGTTRTPLTLDRTQITIAPSGSTPVSTTRQCCVTKVSETEYRYDPNPKNADECRGNPPDPNKVFKQDVCQGSVENTVCSDFCKTRTFNGGTCLAFGTVQDTTTQFGGICQQGTCQCGTVNQQQQLARESCQNFCMTNTQYSGYASQMYTQQALSIPYGQCASNPELILSTFQIAGAVGGQAAGAQASAQIGRTGNLGENQCAPNERCYCIYSRINTASASTPNTVPTIPGTQSTPRWTAPDDITASAPQKPPNDRNCVAAVSAQITASFGTTGAAQGTGQAQISGLRLVQAGDPITVVGKVTKISDQCNGYQYQCRQQQEVNCKISQGFGFKGFTTDLEYDKCPAGFEKIQLPGAEQGEGSFANMRRNFGTLGFAGGVVAMVVNPGLIPALAGPTVQSGGMALSSGCGQAEANQLVMMSIQYAMQQAFRTCSSNQQCSANELCSSGRCVDRVTGNPVPGTIQTLPGDHITTASDCISRGYNCVDAEECSTVAGVCGSTNQICCSTAVVSGGTQTPTQGVACANGCADSASMCLLGQTFSIATCPAGQVCCTLGLSGSGDGTGMTEEQCKAATDLRGTCMDQGSCASVVGATNAGSCQGVNEVCCVPPNFPAGGVTADPTFKVNGESIITGDVVTGKAGENRGYAVNLPNSDGSFSGETITINGAPDGGGGGGLSNRQIGAIASAAVMLGGMFPACPAEEITKCFSVCGKKYESKVSNAPTCEKGGPVIDFDEKQFTCGQGECGGFSGKRVSIKVYGPNGEVAIDDSATAGANGEFSYTFNSPAGDGDFTVIVTAPKE